MTSPQIRIPVPADAPEWFDFVVEQQSRAYRGIVRPDFAEVQRGFRESWVAELAVSFADPGTSRRLIARHDGQVVGVVSVVDAPSEWEIGEGYVPAPAPRCTAPARRRSTAPATRPRQAPAGDRASRGAGPRPA